MPVYWTESAQWVKSLRIPNILSGLWWWIGQQSMGLTSRRLGFMSKFKVKETLTYSSFYVPKFRNIYKTSMLNANQNIWFLNLNGYIAYCQPRTKQKLTACCHFFPRWSQNIQDTMALPSCADNFIWSQSLHNSNWKAELWYWAQADTPQLSIKMFPHVL